jgi:hypothetical protein
MTAAVEKSPEPKIKKPRPRKRNENADPSSQTKEINQTENVESMSSG